VNETGGALAGLHDVVAPAPVSWAPQTLGWAVLAGIVVVVAAWLGWQAWKKARANRYRKVALAEIDRIAGSLRDDPAAALEAVNEVLKRAALTAWPRVDVAALAGPSWLEFLDSTSTGRDFGDGPGRVLADEVYAPAGVRATDEERRAFLDVARRWIRRHRGPEPSRSEPSSGGSEQPEGRAA
jgi:hypothetical protein